MEKKVFSKLCIVASLATILMVSCSKESSSNLENGSVLNGNGAKPSDITDDEGIDVSSFPHYCNGVANGNIDAMDQDSLLSIVYDSAIYYFDQHSLFYSFCQNNGLNDLYETNAKLDSIYAKAVELGIEDEDFDDISEMPQAMQQYWYHIFGTEMSNLPQNQNSRSEAKLTWATKIYDGINFTGDSKTCFGPTYWSLGNFNGRTSSFVLYDTGIGGIWWCHKRWYGKPRTGYFVLSFPIGQIQFNHLNSRNDNKFCSYCTTIH